MIVICLAVYILQAGVKAKKATETYKSFVEKYATAKSEFEQKMAETAQVLLWTHRMRPAKLSPLSASVAFNTFIA